jgi:hypothetical protein
VTLHISKGQLASVTGSSRDHQDDRKQPRDKRRRTAPVPKVLSALNPGETRSAAFPIIFVKSRFHPRTIISSPRLPRQKSQLLSFQQKRVFG